MTIAQTTVRYYDAKGIYRERMFHDKDDLDSFLGRLSKTRAQVVSVG